jgi:hypothetical protein
VGLLAHGPLSDTGFWLPDLGRQAPYLGRIPDAQARVRGDELVALLRETPGPILSEAPSFVLAAGKPVVGNATHLRNLEEAGLWSSAPLVADIRAHRFALIILGAQLYPPSVLDAIRDTYYVEQKVEIGSAVYLIYRPGDP